MPKPIKAHKTETVRIIGGQWRSRKLHFPNVTGLRPTPDRVKETLFNWLAPYIHNAVCLDLFAGSGALGFEALSRGAAKVVMVDQSLEAVKALEENKNILQTDNADIFCVSVPYEPADFLNQKFDIVFLDPPFHQNLIEICCKWLEQSNCLHENSLIYIEAESELKTLSIPYSWSELRRKFAGQVGYHLYSASGPHDSGVEV
jgi:16S rRNA (guanine966-N2)-methyltransferase